MTDAHAAGILPCQSIEDLIAQEAITSQTPFDTDQVQPASLDLRLGARCWRVRASFLPGVARRVPERLKDVAMHELDLTKGAVLEKGCVYIAEIQERLSLPGKRRGARQSQELDRPGRRVRSPAQRPQQGLRRHRGRL
jgi:dCTP deaminase